MDKIRGNAYRHPQRDAFAGYPKAGIAAAFQENFHRQIEAAGLDKDTVFFQNVRGGG